MSYANSARLAPPFLLDCSPSLSPLPPVTMPCSLVVTTSVAGMYDYNSVYSNLVKVVFYS